MKRFLTPGLILLFILGFVVRLYRFNNPVADWHSFRQSDTNAVSAIYVRDGINLLNPRYFDISNVQSGKDNPQGYRLVEFPIYNAIQAGLFDLFDHLTLVEWGRLISIFSSLGGVFFVYQLVRKYANQAAGLFALGFYLFLPFSIYYSRTILPDPSMAAMILGGTYFFDLWLEKLKPNFLIFSIFFTALAFLLKPYALFFTLPIAYLAWKKFGAKIFQQIPLYIFGVVGLIPLILWRKYITLHPEGIPVSAWLFNGNGIRFHPAFFRWIFYERVTKLILGYIGDIFLVLGIARFFKLKNGLFFATFVISSLAYVTVIATGNVQHDYYQILIIPTISIICGIGAAFMLEIFKKNMFLQFQAFVLIAFMLALSWLQVKDYFNINDWGMVNAAQAADQILPKDATVIAPYDGSTTFLNMIQRRGWPVLEKGVDELTKMGAQYLVIANPTPNDFSGFGKTYKHVASGSSYLILKLK